jgi:DNA-binding PadR family transcriptional regulator
MTQQEVLGGFEHQILLVIARLDGESYTVPIVLELQERTGREVASASVFVTLRRLEKRGFLRSAVAPPEPGQVGRPRRMFRIQPAGIAALREAGESLRKLSEGVALLDVT